MINIDHTLIIQIINIIVLVIILNFLLFKPMLKTLDDRIRGIEDGHRKIHNLEGEISALTAAYETRLNLALAEAANLRKKLIEDGTAAAEKLLSQVNDDMLHLQAEHEKDIRVESEEARGLLSRYAETMSVKTVERLLGRSI